VDKWNPAQYEKFKAERSQPFYDLLALVEPREGMRTVDLGCGTGELTAVLHRALSCARTLGIDNSAAMLARSTDYLTAGLRFAEQSISDFSRQKVADAYDLIFSNAALQWASDHQRLLPRLARLLSRAGQLAVQVPANHDHPAQTVARELARREPYQTALSGFERVSPVLLPEEYAELLHACGFTRQQVRLQVYGHLLPDSDAVAEWTRGTVLIDYGKRMEPELFAQFYADYKQLLRNELGDPRPYFFPFKRILLWAAR
jgi:trans-aconitate 2-methyltransferase